MASAAKCLTGRLRAGTPTRNYARVQTPPGKPANHAQTQDIEGATEPMSWLPEVEEIERRKQFAYKLGGKDGVDRQHNQGRLTIRERVEGLVDTGSWREIGALTGSATYGEDGRLEDVKPANAVIGTARLDGRKVAIDGDDYTNRGGSSEATVSEKWIYADQWAHEMNIPLVRLVESAGGSVRLVEKMGHTKIPGYPTWPMGLLLGKVPVIGLALGPCAGLGALKAACAHFSIMVKDTSQVFAGGPPVALEAGMSGTRVDKDELGGWKIHTEMSGVIDNAAASEEDAFAQARRWLSYMPNSVYELPPVIECNDPVDRREEELISVIPRDRRKIYNSRQIIDLVFDKDSVFEVTPKFGRSTVTCLARLNGYPVGVLANDPRFFGGGMNRSAAEKFETFIDICDTFHLPIINLVDQPGTVVGVDAERQGNVRKAVRVLTAIEQTQVPWCAVVVRRLFGLAGNCYGRMQGLNYHVAWPSATWGSIPFEGGIMAAYRRELDGLPEEERNQRLEELETYYSRLSSPFLTAERFRVPDVIDPRQTREILWNWLEDAWKTLPGQLGPVKRSMRK